MKGEMNDEELNLIQAIRRRPAMYIGSTSVRGFNELLRKVIVFSFEDLHAEEVAMELTGVRSGRITLCKIGSSVSDTIATHGFLDDKDRRFPPIELAALNAISDHFEFSLWDEAGNRLKHLAFEKGELKKGNIDDDSFSPARLEMTFDLDETLLELSKALNPYFYLEQSKTLAFLNKSKTLSFGYTVTGRKCEAVFRFETGIQAMIDLRTLGSIYGGTLFDTYFEKDFGDFAAEVSFCFSETSVNEPFLASFANHERTPYDGVHLDAMIAGVEEAVSKFVEKEGLSGEYVLSAKGIRKLLLGAVNITMIRPHYEGSIRGKLISPEIRGPLGIFVTDTLLGELEKHREAAICIVKRIERESQISKFKA